MRILIVDDETFLAELVKLALEADGHVCYAAGSIADGAEVVRRVRIDLVALDLLEGGADPVGWVEDLVLEFPELHGRIVVLTGRALQDPERFRMAGCGATVMPKPFTLHALRGLVARLGNPATADDVSLPERRDERPLAEDS